MLPKTYFPSPEKNRFLHAGDVLGARKYFDQNKPNNLNYLLEKRYKWMNKYLADKTRIIELGCGPGFGAYYYEHKVTFTDIENYPWVDEIVDVRNLPFEDDSVDAFLCSHMIHHIAQPKKFLETMRRKLRKGGYVVIQEAELSFFLKLTTWLFRHEGWSDEIDIFDDDQICNDPEDPWSANGVIPKHLFEDEDRFERNMAGYRIRKNELSECFIWLLSGGVIVRMKTINLPRFLLKIIDRLDMLLIKVAPKMFAFGRSVVLEKIE